METVQGKHILIVEDHGLIGEVIAESISGAGGCPLGPVVSEREAFDVIEYNFDKPDAAILDVRLNGTSFNLASRLQDLGVPFIFASGHCDDLPERFRDVPICEKPYTIRTLLSVLAQAMVTARVRSA